MLERFQKLLNNLKEEQKEGMIQMSMEKVQDLFKMQDLNKWLKFNAINEEQIQRVQKLEEHLQSTLKRLCVPIDYQSKNA